MSIRLGRSGVFVGGLVLGGATFFAGGWGLAAAQAVEPIAVAPDSGPPGTAITVSGGGCTGTSVDLTLLQGDDTLDLTSATPDGAGDWSGTLTVPDDGSLAGAQLAVTADCLDGDVVYGDSSFSVDEDPTTTTSTTTSTTTTSTTTTTTVPGGPGPSPTTTTTTEAPTTTSQPSSSGSRTPANAVTRPPNFAG